MSINGRRSYGSADPRAMGKGVDYHSSAENVSPELLDQSTVLEFKSLNSPEEPLTSVFLNLPIWWNTCVLKYANRSSLGKKKKKKVFGGQRLWKNQSRNLPPGG